VFIEDIKSTDQKLLKAFYLKAVSQYVEIKEADELSSRISAEVHRFKNGRGVIGALAALGSVLEDRTYELIAYRNESAKGLRKIDVKSVFDMNAKTYPSTYDNVDLEEKKVLIMPRGRDPVFCGIRGESVDAVNRAWDLVKPLEGISLVQVFETNQGTDCHLKRKGISDVMPYDCVISEGIVSRKPKTVEGGHVIFGLSDATGFLWCAAYEPTGGFRDIIRDLQPGDIVKCCGGVGRHPNTLNLEKIFISKLSKISIASAPMCCGKRMTSAGSSKGFKCRKCGKRASLGDVDVVDVERKLNIGWYEVPPRSRRHLSRPLIRDLNNA
jgi:tRNA(Ile2)-agmatinylcytidine synthase